MSDSSLEPWFRKFLLLVSLGALLGIALELWFSEHVESFVQLIPFGFVAVGLIAVVAVLIRPTRGSLWALRGASIVLAGGAIYGIYEHLSHNVGFELEIRPSASLGDVFWDALYGASPLLAPGALALVAVLAAAATYRHPSQID